jgi:hypothetical protein
VITKTHNRDIVTNELGPGAGGSAGRDARG